MLRAPEPRAKKWIEVDQKLEEKMMAYDRYEILEFLNVIAATLNIKLLLFDWIISFYYI